MSCRKIVSDQITRHQWRIELGDLSGGLNPSPLRNPEDIGGVLDRMSKKNRHLDFLL